MVWASVLALPPGMKVHVRTSHSVDKPERRHGLSDKVGFHSPNEECSQLALVGWIPSGHPSAWRLVASDDKPDETIIDAHDGDVVRLRSHQRARLDALIVAYEGKGVVRTPERFEVAVAIITLRYGRRSENRMARLREPWTWNGYVVEILGIDSRHARVKIRHARRPALE